MHPVLKSVGRFLAWWILLPAAVCIAATRLDAVIGAPALAPYARIPLVVAGVLGAFLARWTQLEKQMRGIGPVSGPGAGGITPRGAHQPQLHVTGPYRLTRHPLVWGGALYLFGWTAAAGTWSGTIYLVPAVVAVSMLFARLVTEPRLLAAFGPAAQTWRAATPFLPDLRRLRQAMQPPSAPPPYLFTRGFVRSIFRNWCDLEHPPAMTVPGSGPLVVIANHRSYLDAFLLAASFPRPIAFLSAEEAFRPLWSRLSLQALGCIRLRRHRPDPAAIRKALRTLDAGGVVGVFPEGERSWDGGPSPILAGVARFIALADVPILAVTISGSYRLWPRWGRGPSRTCVRLDWDRPRSPRFDPNLQRWIVEVLTNHPSAPSYRLRSSMDVGRLLWRCPQCRHPDAVRGRRDGRVFCLRCGSNGLLLDGSHLDWNDSGPRPLRAWARLVALRGAERRVLGPGGPMPHRRWPFLRVSDGSGDGPLTRRGKGEAVLTPDALVLRATGWRAHIPAGAIRSVAVEGSHKLQVATARRTYELRYRRGSPRGPRAHLEAWLDARGLVYRRG
jgi:1-acyl-sn-glycerol-3-phosphate acyltransferase